jgi:predicted kinase
LTRPPVLIAFSGLPGTGKSTVARKLAAKISAVWLRIDTIEQGMRDSTAVCGPINDAGYRAAYGVAADNLQSGLSVVADCVSDCTLTRDAWRDVGLKTNARVVEVEVICADPHEHRRRVEDRTVEISGLDLPRWEEVIARPYESWDRDRLIIDTARLTPDECIAVILAVLSTTS